MGTEVAMSFSALRAQLESEKSSLYKIDASIKKIVQNKGRFSDRFNNSSGDYNRPFARVGRNVQPEGNFNKNEELFGKRRHETKTVFSRLSKAESDGEEEGGVAAKRSRVHSAVTRELPSRDEVVKAQGGDEQARTRNRRMFGSLLGTLHKFKQEEIGLQNKEEKKKQVEQKIEEQARLQKEKEQQERKSLFAEREQKKTKIKALEAKVARVQEFEQWEISQRSLGCFILTNSKPAIYWMPRKMSDRAQDKLDICKKNHEELMLRRREELKAELERIQARADLRAHHAEQRRAGDHNQNKNRGGEVEGGNRRDKFAADGDRHHDSDDDLPPHPPGDDNTKNGTIDTTAFEESHLDAKPGDESSSTTDEDHNNVSETENDHNTTSESLPQVNNESLPQDNNESLPQDNESLPQDNETLAQENSESLTDITGEEPTADTPQQADETVQS